MTELFNPGRELQKLRPRKTKTCIICGKEIIGIVYKNKPEVCTDKNCKSKYYYRRDRVAQGKKYRINKPKISRANNE